MPIIKIRDVNIHYRIFGGTGPWLALITGGRRGFNEFIPFAEKIAAKGFQVLLHDRRNTGASDVLIAGQDGEEEIWADDLEILLNELGASSAFIGGTSSGARLSMLYNQRHPQKVNGLLLMRVTGGEFAAGRLPEMYYGQFIRAAQQGGMTAVCETEQYRERIQANPSNLPRLMAMDPKEYIGVMEHWVSIFLKGPRKPVLGMEEDVLRAIRVPTMVIPGNDKTHASANGIAAANLIPNSVLFKLPIEDQDIALLPFSDWEPHEETLAIKLTEFMNQSLERRGIPPKPIVTFHSAV